MTRQIKFRAWNKQENKMLWRKLFEMNWYSTPKNDDNGCHTWGAISGGQERFLEIMQFTNIVDKNGKEIYEGDILKGRYGGKKRVDIWEVTYSTDEASYGMKALNGIENRIAHYKVSAGEYEIIGNIYENSDLLS